MKVSRASALTILQSRTGGRSASPVVNERGDHAELNAMPATLHVPATAPWVAVAHNSDPLLLALARYVQALDQRYPDGPDQMRDTRLATRANMPTVLHPKGPAA